MEDLQETGFIVQDILGDFGLRDVASADRICFVARKL
jgi:hypothetical protein